VAISDALPLEAARPTGLCRL